MSILHGVLHLLKPTAPRGLRLPIDFFLRSLAQDQQEHSVGVILSGMGSDGTLGLRAIKEKAGVVLVQEPATAKFDSMPRSAIDAGLADIVAPAEELPGKILAYLQRTPLLAADGRSAGRQDAERPGKSGHPAARPHGQRLFLLQTEHALSPDRAPHGHSPDQQDVGLCPLLAGEFAGAGSAVQGVADRRDELFPRPRRLGAVARRGHSCAAGEPPARQDVAGVGARLFHGRRGLFSGHRVQGGARRAQAQGKIFDSNLCHRPGQGRDRKGAVRVSFPSNIAADVSEARLKRFFTKEEHGYRVRKEIRELVIFAPQNLIMEPPFTKLDILSCRNLLIYLTTEVQKKLIPLFHYSLNPGGILFQGSAETIGDFTNLFHPARMASRGSSGGRNPSCDRSKLFFLLPLPPVRPLEFRSASGRPNRPPVSSRWRISLVLQSYAPPAVLTNDTGDIFYVSGRTGKYLEPAAGKANWNIFAMAREGLRYELTNAFKEALRQKESVTLHGLKVGTNGGTQYVDVTVQRLD